MAAPGSQTVLSQKREAYRGFGRKPSQTGRDQHLAGTTSKGRGGGVTGVGQVKPDGLGGWKSDGEWDLNQDHWLRTAGDQGRGAAEQKL